MYLSAIAAAWSYWDILTLVLAGVACLGIIGFLYFFKSMRKVQPVAPPIKDGSSPSSEVEIIRAIANYEVQKTSSKEPAPAQATLNEVLGTCYLELARRIDRTTLLSKAISELDEALRRIDRNAEPSRYAEAASNLASALRLRFELADRPEDIERAVGVLKESLSLPQTSDVTGPALLNNLGLALMELATVKEPEKHLVEAVSAFESSLRAYSSEANQHEREIVSSNLQKAKFLLEHVKLSSQPRPAPAVEAKEAPAVKPPVLETVLTSAPAVTAKAPPPKPSKPVAPETMLTPSSLLQELSEAKSSVRRSPTIGASLPPKAPASVAPAETPRNETKPVALSEASKRKVETIVDAGSQPAAEAPKKVPVPVVPPPKEPIQKRPAPAAAEARKEPSPPVPEVPKKPVPRRAGGSILASFLLGEEDLDERTPPKPPA